MPPGNARYWKKLSDRGHGDRSTLVRRETWIDLFCDNTKTLEQMLTEYRRDRNVAGVAPASDQAPANAAAVMPRVEGVPMSA